MQRRTPLRRKTPLRQRATGSSTQTQSSARPCRPPPAKRPAPLRSRGLRPTPTAVRAAVVLRDGGCCVLCGRPGVHVHHVRSRGAGGRHEAPNLCLLCAEDHARVHADPDRKRALLAALRARGIVPPEV